MKPTFRTDLTCSREEQQGVVFYRIDDPKAQTSFRLYEIEYLIAKKLDGSRALLEVIAAVKKEFNFDISEPDLQRFVNQLESMGFLTPREGAPEPSEPEPETAVMERPQRPPEAPTESKPVAQPLDLLDDDQLSKPGGDLDQAELDRLLRSAFLHVKQGYIVHARDYFLAAKELNPTDERLTKLVHHLEIIGDSSGPAEVEYLWNQAKELFPDVAEDVGPLIDAKSGGPPPELGEPTERIASTGDEDLKSRVVWALVALVVLAGGVGGLVFVFSNYGHRIFGTAARVRVATLKAERIPIYFDGGATAVSPLEKRWAKASGSGTIDKVNVAVGDRVEKGQILVTLQLADKMKKQLAKARKGVKKATNALDKAKKRLSKLNAEREAIETERTAAEEQLEELTSPDSVLKKGSSRDVKKWREVKVEANKKLSRLAKKERGPRKQLKKAEKKLAGAQRKLDGVYEKIGDKIVRADFSGVVGELEASVGKSVSAKDQLVLLTDPSGVQLTFEVGSKPELQAGGAAHVSVSRGVPNEARVIKVTEKGTVAIKLPDPSGGFPEIEPGEFRLVREFAEPAFSVPSSAIIEGEEGYFVLVASQKRALARKIAVLHRDSLKAVIRDKSDSLRDGVEVVTVHVEDLPLSDIPEGSFLDIEK